MSRNQEDKIAILCKNEGYTFIGWVDGNDSKYSKFEWYCEKNHKNSTMAKGFLKAGHRCDICNFGFFRRNAQALDHLYLIKLDNENESFIKIGRTFDLQKRMEEFKEVGYVATILSNVRANHETIFKLEQTYHKALADYQYIPTIKFVGWTECYNEVVLSELKVISKNNFYLKQLNT